MWSETGIDTSGMVYRKTAVSFLDEHTAALDPKTAAKVLEATDRIVGQDNLTTLDDHPQHEGCNCTRQSPGYDV